MHKSERSIEFEAAEVPIDTHLSCIMQLMVQQRLGCCKVICLWPVTGSSSWRSTLLEVTSQQGLCIIR